MGHGQDSVNAGVNLWSSPRSPGGKSNRDSYRLDDFFKGGHDELVDPNSGWSIWMPSLFPPHPKDEVIADIQSRNSAIDLNGLNDDDLIDLYLRREPQQDPDWAQRVQERKRFGIDPDAYIETSTRDTIMRRIGVMQGYRFIQRIIINGCIDWKQYENPDDSKIGALLRE